MQKIVYFIGYAVVRLMGSVINFLPFSFALFLARPIGFLMYALSKKPRTRALENLRAAYGSEKSEAEIKAIAQGAFRHLAEFGVEWLRMPQIVKAQGRYFAINHVERIHAALRNRRGVMILVSHNGNWEIMALIGGLLIAKPVGASVYALARPIKNPYLYKYALHLRELTGLKSIDKLGGVRETFAYLKENGIVSILADQRVSEGGIETNFFGRPALTTSLPAIAALRLGTPIFFAFLHRTQDLRYILDVEGPVSIETTGNVRHDIEVTTQKFNDRIEVEIRKDPRRWLWMHNRWRVPHGAK